MKFALDLATPDLNLRAGYFSAPFLTVDGIRLHFYLFQEVMFRPHTN